MKNLINYHLCCLLLGLFIPGFLASQSRIYVNREASSPVADGSSWELAFPDLQQALAVANPGDSIWVAKGVYFPTDSDDRSISFNLLSGTALYGGFAGSESQLDERNWSEHTTILSGAIGSSADTDNSLHVVRGIGLDSTTRIDGFVIERGRANLSGPFPDRGGGGLYLAGSAAIPHCALIVKNCSFLNNYANLGGGLYAVSGAGQAAVPRLENCVFKNNFAMTEGGAVFIQTDYYTWLEFVAKDCDFIENKVQNYGGGAIQIKELYNTYRISGCLFERDSCVSGLGGAINVEASGVLEGQLVVDSCIFYQNLSTQGGGFAFASFFQGNHYAFDFSNSEFIENKVTNATGSAMAFLVLSDGHTFDINLNNNRYTRNVSNSGGAVLVEVLYDGQAVLNARNCTFISNWGLNPNFPYNNRPAVWTRVLYEGGKIQSNFSNCLFAHNGGAIHSEAGEAIIENVISNCTFYNNGEFPLAKLWIEDFDYETFYSQTWISNSIFMEDTPFPFIFFNAVISSYNVNDYFIDNCLINAPNCLVPGGIEACGDNNLFELDPLFQDPDNLDFSLMACSPAANKGNTFLSDSLGLVVDLAGLPRVAFDTVDIGAYEVQDSCVSSSAFLNKRVPNTLHIYPNPATDQLFFSISDLVSESGSYSVINAAGKVCKIGPCNENGVPVADLPNGLYVLQIRDGRNLWQEVFFKK
jgi:hypothetical protein